MLVQKAHGDKPQQLDRWETTVLQKIIISTDIPHQYIRLTASLTLCVSMFVLLCLGLDGWSQTKDNF